MKEGQAAVKKHRENETEDREKKRSIAPAAWVSIARSSARPPPAAVAAMAAAFTDEDAGGSAKSDAARGRLTGILSITFRYKTVFNKAFI